MSNLSFLLSPVAIAAILTSLLLIAVDLFLTLRYTVWARRPLPRWTRFLPGLAFGLMIVQIAANIAFNFILDVLRNKAG